VQGSAAIECATHPANLTACPLLPSPSSAPFLPQTTLSTDDAAALEAELDKELEDMS
jgi:hypothetical protein